MPFTSNQNIPAVAVPMGDPAGIGPEIIVKSLIQPEITGKIKCIIAGSRKVLEKACFICAVDQAVLDSPFVEIIEVPVSGFDPSSVEYGKVSAPCGTAAYEWIKKSIELCTSGQACACATPPINKESLKAAEVPFIGHTEIFAALTHTDDPLTLFEVRALRIFFLSRHVPLAKACTMVTKERIIDYVMRCTQALEQLGITKGTMAVAGLNPHSGEHGLFGSEEVTQVAPAVQELRTRGYDVEGPVSADSVFYLALQGRYNSVLSLYHDQGHIAAKTYDFERTISVTCGMPILRTSVDHGTAFDIAGTGKASAVSMTEAIILAAKYGRK